MKDGKTLKHYMSKKHRDILGNRPTWHSNCTKATQEAKDGKVFKSGVSRPGKTARDRARKAHRE